MIDAFIRRHSVKIALALGTLGALALLACIVLHIMDIRQYPSLSVFEGKPIGSDFWAFYSAGMLADAGVPWAAYQSEATTSAMASLVKEVNKGALVLGLYYPPPYLLLLMPFALLPYYPALLLFFFTGLGLSLWALWRFVPQRWIILSFFLFSAVVLNFVVGQNGLLTSGLFALGMSYLATAPAIAGLFFGLLFIKPQLGLLLPFALIAGREGRAFKFASLTTLGLIGLSLAVFGIVTWLLWPAGTFAASTYLTNRIEIMQRMPTVLSLVRLANADWALSYVLQHEYGYTITKAMAALWLHLIIAIPAAVMVFYVWAKSKAVTLRAAAYASGTLLITPFLYDYDHAWLWIPIVMLGLHASRTQWRGSEIALMIIGLAWPLSINKIPATVHMQIGFIVPFLFLILTVMRVWSENKAAKRAANQLQPQS